MGSGGGEDASGFRPLEIAFPDEEIQRAGTLVTCSPAAHHADPLPLAVAIELYQTGSETQVQGRGMVTARETIYPAYQLKDDYGDRVKTGVFAQITTRTHDAYPRVILFGFSMVSRSVEFSFPNSVQERVETRFETADLVRTGRNHLTVITDDYALHESIIEEFLIDGIREWRNTDSPSPP